VPGPLQVTLVPSPMSQTILTGVAVAVEVTPPAEALWLTGAQKLSSTHSQVGRFTTASCPDGGEVRTTGVGIWSWSQACWASTAGSGGGAGAPAGIQRVPFRVPLLQVAKL